MSKRRFFLAIPILISACAPAIQSKPPKQNVVKENEPQGHQTCGEGRRAAKIATAIFSQTYQQYKKESPLWSGLSGLRQHLPTEFFEVALRPLKVGILADKDHEIPCNADVFTCAVIRNLRDINEIESKNLEAYFALLRPGNELDEKRAVKDEIYSRVAVFRYASITKAPPCFSCAVYHVFFDNESPVRDEPPIVFNYIDEQTEPSGRRFLEWGYIPKGCEYAEVYERFVDDGTNLWRVELHLGEESEEKSLAVWLTTFFDIPWNGPEVKTRRSIRGERTFF